MNTNNTVKVLKSKEEIVKYTMGKNACIVIDCTGKEDEFYNCYRAKDCVCALKENRYSDYGYCRVMQEAIMFRDAFNDGKNRLVFHSEVCGIKGSFGVQDILDRAHKFNLPTVNGGDTIVIIAKINAGEGKVGAIVQAVDIKCIGLNGEIILHDGADVEIATRIFKAIDSYKALA